MWEETVAFYDKLIATHPDIERKGKTMPYTSTNGYMFSMVNKAGEIGMRLPKERRAAFMETHNATVFMSYGAVIREYVLIPESLYENIELLAQLLDESYQYTCSLPPKPGKKKK